MNRQCAMAVERPNASESSVPWGAGWPLLVAVATALSACGAVDVRATAPVDAPTWGQVAFGKGDADLVAAIDLRALDEDPVFGPLVAHLARNNDLGVLTRASQIDLVARVDQGNPTSWIAVIHGVDGRPGRSDVGSSAPDAVTAPGTWVLGEGPAFERIRASPGLASPRISLPHRALLASTVQGRAIPRPRQAELVDLTEGLQEATMVVLGGAHLEIVFRCRYVDAAAARHAATAARLALVAGAARTDAVSELARALAKLDFDANGSDVSVRLTVSDDLRELLQRYVEHASDG
jgi:hypothetical protein